MTLHAEELTWIIIVRLMRNVLCHEQFFDWRDLKEFKQQLLNLFKSEDRFMQMMTWYEKNCSASITEHGM